jgi:histidinol-phosphate aminotransferase
MDANENPYGPSPKVFEALAKAETLHIYPDPEQRKLRAGLGRYVSFEPEWLIGGAGSDELIDLLIRMFVPAGASILNFPPTFSFYPFLAGIANARSMDVLRKPDYTLDLPKALDAAKDASLIIGTSPNNPTGTVMTREEIEALLRTGKPVIVDEAYTEFAGESCVAMVREHANLIVLRTLSKWAGLAGLRVGYMIAHPALIDTVLRIKQPYNINVAAEIATLASLDDLPWLQERIDAMIRERDRMAALLAEMPGVTVTPSQANFVLCHLEAVPAREVHRRLLEQGILVRYFDTPLLQNHIRVSAGRPEQTDALVAAMREILAAAATA